MPRLTGSSIPSAYTNEQGQQGVVRKRRASLDEVLEMRRNKTITMSDGSKIKIADLEKGEAVAYAEYQKILDDTHGTFLFFCLITLFGTLLFGVV